MPRWHNPVLRKPGIVHPASLFPQGYPGNFGQAKVSSNAFKRGIPTEAPRNGHLYQSWEIQIRAAAFFFSIKYLMKPRIFLIYEYRHRCG